MSAPDFFPVLTQVGRDAVAAAQAEGRTLPITTIAVGTGSYQPDGLETALADEQDRAGISRSDYIGDGVWRVAAKIAPASRDYHTASCRAEGGLARFTTMVDASPVIAGKSGLDGKDPAKSGAALSDEEQAACRVLGLTEAEFTDAKSKE